MILKTMQIASAAPGMHVDGNGLYLSVTVKGGKSWIFRYQLGGKRREMGLASLLALKPPEARAKVAQLRVMVVNGIDPLAEREADKLADLAERRALEVDQMRLTRIFPAAA